MLNPNSPDFEFHPRKDCPILKKHFLTNTCLKYEMKEKNLDIKITNYKNLKGESKSITIYFASGLPCVPYRYGPFPNRILPPVM